MALLVCNEGELELLSRALNKTSGGNLILRLFKNDVIPSETDVVSTYQEATANGYQPIPLVGTNWTVGTVSGVTTAEYPPQTFQVLNQSDTQYYGYFITDADGDTLIWAERFSDGPYAMGTAGGSVKITPRIVLD